jgi:predicted RNA-binding Zn ribbon-like protein
VAEALALDPGAYGGTYKLIGGSLALDFANLVSYRDTNREHDWLIPESNVGIWTAANGLKSLPPTLVAELREIRETLARTFLAIADGEMPQSPDITSIGELATAAWSRRQLRFADGTRAAEWHDDRLGLPAILALDAVSLLTSPGALARVAACEECRWVFLDTTRNHSRRWCDPADCGNRARQRRHYERHVRS